MNWFDLSFSIEGKEYIARTFRVLGANISEWMYSEFWEIGKMLVWDAVSNFENEGSETGGAWKPLASSTVLARKNRSWYYRNPWMGAGATGPILKWTGRMKRGLRSSIEMWGKAVEVDNPVEYFKYHQSKTRNGRKLPRRLILEIKQSSKLKVSNIIAWWLQRGLPWGIFGRQY